MQVAQAALTDGLKTAAKKHEKGCVSGFFQDSQEPQESGQNEYNSSEFPGIGIPGNILVRYCTLYTQSYSLMYHTVYLDPCLEFNKTKLCIELYVRCAYPVLFCQVNRTACPQNKPCFAGRQGANKTQVAISYGRYSRKQRSIDGR